MNSTQPTSAPLNSDDAPHDEMTGRVLIVDDLAANVRLLSGILKIAGFEVATASSGAQALEMLPETAPDVVLLDIMMPEMDGFEVCRRIRSTEATATLPVVLVTALQETEDKVRGIEAGADDFLTKPVEEVEVVARVRSLVQVKRGREELETAYRDLKSAQKLRENLAAMLVHDLRTPLTTMLASLDLLQSDGFGSLEALQLEMIAMCARSGQHLLSLVNELLDIGKLEAGQMQLQRAEVAIPTLIESAVAHVVGQARSSNTRVEIEVEPTLPLLSVDDDLMRRVLINLLGNAVKFTRMGSEVIIAAHRQAQEAGEAIVFSVRDQGEGIAADDQERIFDKFAQVETHANGQKVSKRHASTGMGLTFCKLAVEAHHGRIWVESEIGEGSTFFVAIDCGPSDSSDG